MKEIPMRMGIMPFAKVKKQKRTTANEYSVVTSDTKTAEIEVSKLKKIQTKIAFFLSYPPAYH